MQQCAVLHRIVQVKLPHAMELPAFHLAGGVQCQRRSVVNAAETACGSLQLDGHVRPGFAVFHQGANCEFTLLFTQ